MIDSINVARSARGLSPVHRSTQLEAAALEHAKDMAANSWIIESKNYHTGSNGSTIEERIRSTGYNPIRWSEITGHGFGGDEAKMFDWWMASPVHRDAILATDVTEAGVARLYAPSSPWGYYWAVEFGRPAAAPTATACPCCGRG